MDNLNVCIKSQDGNVSYYLPFMPRAHKAFLELGPEQKDCILTFGGYICCYIRRRKTQITFWFWKDANG